MSIAGPLSYQITQQGGSCLADLDSGAVALIKHASVKGTCIADMDSQALALTSH